MPLAWTVTKTGTGTAADKRTALRLIREENARRTAINEQLARETPPGTPLAMLPFATNPQIESSAETIMGQKALSFWDSASAEAAQPPALASRTTDAERSALAQATIDRLDAGATVAQIITDLQS